MIPTFFPAVVIGSSAAELTTRFCDQEHLQGDGSSADPAGNMARQTEHTANADVGERLRQLRRTLGKSRGQLARASALTRRQVAAFERGKSSLSEADLRTLAEACGVDVDELAPRNLRLALAAHALSDQGAVQLEGEAARDALLREYVLMLVDLRGSVDVPASSLRQDDLEELARVVGGTPAAIEERLTYLLEASWAHSQPGP